MLRKYPKYPLRGCRLPAYLAGRTRPPVAVPPTTRSGGGGIMWSGLMRRTGITLALVGSAVVAAGCYHTVITTDLPPSTEVYHEPWRPAFVAGLVPAQVDASKYCGGRRW